MSVIKVEVAGRELSFTDMPTVTAGAFGVDSIQFKFPDEDDIWAGYAKKTCVFFKNKTEYIPEILDLNNIAKIPSKILENEGVVYLGLCGIKDDTRLTSTILAYNVKNGVYCNDNTEDDEFAKTNFEMLLERCDEIFASHASINERLDGVEDAMNPTYSEDAVGLVFSVGPNQKPALMPIFNDQFTLDQLGVRLTPIKGAIWFANQVRESLKMKCIIFDVVAYGANGDGKTDDGWAIQTAIDTCKEWGGGTIYFPKGIYNITRTLFYYSNMTFKFEEGAKIRTMTDTVHGSRLPSIVFAPYFETDIAYLNNGKGTYGFNSNRYAVENVIFEGGVISGYYWNGSSVNTSPSTVVLLACLCRNIKFYNMKFDGNASGGHCIEINSSTDVTVRDCRFTNYVSDGQNGRYAENLQIDAATSAAVGSKYIITKNTTSYTAPNGVEYDEWYSYTNGNMSYRSLGGYFDFTLLPPGDQYDVAQTVIETKLGKNTAAIKATPGFHQCCHNIEIASCYFENNDMDCRVCAIGCHTYFKDGGSENYASSTQDKHSGIKIHDNTFVWSSNRVDGSAASNWRGVIGFGHYEAGAWQDPHIYNVSIHGNMFYRNRDYLMSNDGTSGAEEKVGYAITVNRGGNRYTRENINLPQTKYNIYGNFYAGINGWENGTSAEIYQQGSSLVVTGGISTVQSSGKVLRI